MKRRSFIAMAIAASLLPRPALATADCVDTLSNSTVYNDGSVIITGSWRGTYTQICNVKTEWKGITPDVCANWKAMVDAGLSLGRTVRLYYNTGSFVCSTIPTWGDAPAPQYVMLF